MNRRFLFILLLLIVLLLVAVGSLLPSGAQLLPWYRPNLTHVLVYAMLAFLIGWNCSHRRGAWWIGLLTAAAFGLLLECAQYFIPAREARLDDALLNVLGAILGTLLLFAFKSARRQIVQVEKNRSQF